MQTELVVKNFVLVGNFSPIFFDKYFFIKNDIVKESDIIMPSVFGTEFVQLNTSKFQISIGPQQLVISDRQPEIANNIIADIFSLIFKSSPRDFLSALGINFHWFVSDDAIALSDLSRTNFFNENSKIYSNYFSSKDSMFGAYMSTNFRDARLKLDIKPNIVQLASDLSIKNTMNFGFNFHFDQKKVEAGIEKYISDYDFYQKHSQEIISLYNE